MNSILTRFNIMQESNKLPSRISGGQQQRCAIARAVISGADVILADEPTGALDEIPRSGKGIVMDQLVAELGSDEMTKTLIYYILEVNEAFHEELSWGDFPTPEAYENSPCVVIGAGLMDRTYEKQGVCYIDLFDRIPCRVTGVFQPIVVKQNDDRCYLFWDNIPEDIWAELKGGAVSSYFFTIYSSSPIAQSDIQIYVDVLVGKNGGNLDGIRGTVSDYGETGMVNTGMNHNQIIPLFLANILLLIISLFSVIVVILLSYFWIIYQRKTWLIQYVCGLSKIRIGMELFIQFFCYNIIGFISVYVAYSIVLVYRHKLQELMMMFHVCKWGYCALLMILPIVVCVLPFGAILKIDSIYRQNSFRLRW